MTEVSDLSTIWKPPYPDSLETHPTIVADWPNHVHDIKLFLEEHTAVSLMPSHILLARLLSHSIVRHVTAYYSVTRQMD